MQAHHWVAVVAAVLLFGGVTRGDVFAVGPLLNSGPPTVLRYSPSGQYLGRFPPAGPITSEAFSSLTRGPDGNLYLLGNIVGQGYVLRVNLAGAGSVEGVYANQGQPLLRQLTSPYGIAFDPSGRLHVGSGAVPDIASSRTAIFRHDPPGLTPVQVYSSTTQLGDIEFDAAGNLFVGIAGQGIHRYPLADGAEFTIPTSTYDFNFGTDGKLYVAAQVSGVLRFDPETGEALGTFVPTSSQGLVNAYDLAFGDDGILYVNDRGARRILKYDALTGAPAGVFADYGALGQDVVSIAYAVPEPAGATLLIAAGTRCALASRRRRS